MQQVYQHNKPFTLESGDCLSQLEIAYTTYGEYNGNNAIWFCHALTANADPQEWWPGLVGKGKLFDPEKYYIIGANIVGSCYGSTGPTSIDPHTGKPYLKTFPFITIRDMTRAHIILRKHLQIERINTLLGGSMGGFQALEWGVFEPEKLNNIILLATNAKQSPWAIGIHKAQRMAIENDPSWKKENLSISSEGLKIARAIALLNYRHYEAYQLTQKDEKAKFKEFKIESYLEYQGEKLLKRFDPFTYWVLTNAMDTHDLSRDRGSLEKVLGRINNSTLVIGVDSDMLCPSAEQLFLAQNIPNATYKEISSIYGHDGFLIEYESISQHIHQFLNHVNG